MIPIRASAAMPPPARAVALGSGQVQARMAAVLARPLFSPSRRPAVSASTPGPAVVAAALPRMTGVLVTPTIRRAIFAGPDGKSVVVAEGGRLGPFTVLSVRAGQAVVSGPDGERTVSPVFDRNAPSPTSPGVQPGPPPELPGLPGFRLNGGGLGGVPGLTAPDLAPPRPPGNGRPDPVGMQGR